MDFSEWIVSELDKRGWSRSEAARRGDISPSMFDKVINGYSNPGVKFIEGLARAFKISPAEVMVHMGNKPVEIGDAWVEEMEMKLRRLSPGMRSMASRFIDSMLEDEQQDVKRKTKPKPKSTSA